LKAWYVQHIDNTPPFIHDLVRLAEKAALPLDESKKDLLDSISTFNIRARYVTEKWIEIIKELRAWLKQNLLKQQ
jgi:hypothetical protein